VTGTLLNAAAVLLGALAGWLGGRDLPPAWQRRLGVVVGAWIALAGLATAWQALPRGAAVRTLGIALAALVLGGLAGRLLRLQAGATRAIRFARERFVAAAKGEKVPAGEAFRACTALLALTPLAFLGPVAEGAGAGPLVLAVKAAMDGLAAVSFGRLFRAPAVLAVLPMAALQGTLALGTAGLRPWLAAPAAAPALLVTTGLLVAAVALVALDVRKIRWAELLPAVPLAALLAAGWG
jgi:hypothetical protein